VRRRYDPPTPPQSEPRSRATYDHPVARRPREQPSTPRQTHPDRARPSTPSRRLNGRAHTGSNRFPPNKFRYFLTLFSKFFASFPHGTCSLSVSRQYLALGEIYLPFRLQSRATRLSGTSIQRTDRWPNTGLSPSLAPLSRGLGPRRALCWNLQTTIRNSRTKVQIGSLSSSLFTRRYWGNRGYFLLLRLLICLSSAGRLP
jgi:hypothetical protein